MNDAAAAVTALQPDHWIKASEDAVSAERFHQRHPLGAKDMINLLVKTLEGKAQETSTIADILIKNPDLDPANFCFKTYEVVTLAVIFRDHVRLPSVPFC
jgi:hypothetical protein